MRQTYGVYTEPHGGLTHSALKLSPPETLWQDSQQEHENGLPPFDPFFLSTAHKEHFPD